MNLIKRVTDKIRRIPLLVKPVVRHSLIAIPDIDVIDCEIETPQFHGCQEKFHMYKQRGTFYKSDMKFIHSGLLTGYNVQFHNIEDFQRALWRVF
jgi:hypothetical protein